VELGATVDACDTKGQTAVHYVAQKDLPGICRLLVELGATVDARDEKGHSALHCAVNEAKQLGESSLWRQGGVPVSDICRLLVEINANVDLPDLDGNTPLMRATVSGKRATVITLLEMGASVTAENHAGETAFMMMLSFSAKYSRRATHDQNVKVFGEDVCLQLMTTAAQRKQFFEIRLQVEASRECNEANVRSLVAAGVNVDALALSADGKAGDKDGKFAGSALHFAAENNHPDMCRLLLELNATVDLASNGGDTALMRAACRCNRAAVETLLELGANAAAENHNGKTAYAQTSERMRDKLGESTCLRLITTSPQRDEFHVKYLRKAVLSGDEAKVRSLVATGAKLNSDTLHSAARTNQPDICRLLVELNATVDLANHDGSTPLMTAANVGSRAAVVALLDMKASVTAENHAGDTALTMVIAPQTSHRSIRWRTCRLISLGKEVCLRLMSKGAQRVDFLERDLPVMISACEDELRVAAEGSKTTLNSDPIIAIRSLVAAGANVDSQGELRHACSACRSVVLSSCGNFVTRTKEPNEGRGASHSVSDMFKSNHCDQHDQYGSEYDQYDEYFDCDNHDEITSELFICNDCRKAAGCTTCGCSAEQDVLGNRICYCDTCTRDGCRPPYVIAVEGSDEKVAALHIAAGSNRHLPDICLVLLELNATLDIRDHNGDTPLMWAVRESCWAAAGILLNAGASTTATNKEGKTANDMLCCSWGTESPSEVMVARIDPETWQFHGISQFRSLRSGCARGFGLNFLNDKGHVSFLRLPLGPPKRPSTNHAVLKLHSKDAICTVLLVGAKTYNRPWGELPEIPNEITLLILEFVSVKKLGLSAGEVKERDRLRQKTIEAQTRIRSKKNEGNLNALNAMLADAVACVSAREREANNIIAVVRRDFAKFFDRKQKRVEKRERDEMALENYALEHGAPAFVPEANQALAKADNRQMGSRYPCRPPRRTNLRAVGRTNARSRKTGNVRGETKNSKLEAELPMYTRWLLSIVAPHRHLSKITKILLKPFDDWYDDDFYEIESKQLRILLRMVAHLKKKKKSCGPAQLIREMVLCKQKLVNSLLKQADTIRNTHLQYVSSSGKLL
jgi:serine/threonine-protein phosphatase 6 regulatory ankyrin repeat subunit B